MKIRLRDLRRIIKEEVSRTLNEAATGDYGQAYEEILNYAKGYDMGYKETPGLGGGTMLSPAGRNNTEFNPSPTWSSLSNFEKYCLAFGRMGENPECDVILTSAGAKTGAYSEAGLRGLTSGDFSSFAQQVMGGKYPNNYGIEIEYERKTMAHRADKEKKVAAERAAAQRDRMNAERRAKRATAKSTV